MKVKNIAEKVVGVLPGCSIFAYTERQKDKSPKERDGKIKYGSKIIGHTVYAMVFSAYLATVVISGNWNPAQYIKGFEKIKIALMRPNELEQKLFGENGYADKDGEKGISPSERFEVYKRLRLEHTIKFPDLYLKDLERAVKSYEADNQE